MFAVQVIGNVTTSVILTVILRSLAMSYPLHALDPHRRDAGEAMDNTVLEGKGQEGCVP